MWPNSELQLEHTGHFLLFLNLGPSTGPKWSALLLYLLTGPLTWSHLHKGNKFVVNIWIVLIIRSCIHVIIWIHRSTMNLTTTWLNVSSTITCIRFYQASSIYTSSLSHSLQPEYLKLYFRFLGLNKGIWVIFWGGAFILSNYNLYSLRCFENSNFN